jgi:hypothetical protein
VARLRPRRLTASLYAMRQYTPRTGPFPDRNSATIKLTHYPPFGTKSKYPINATSIQSDDGEEIGLSPDLISLWALISASCASVGINPTYRIHAQRLGMVLVAYRAAPKSHGFNPAVGGIAHRGSSYKEICGPKPHRLSRSAGRLHRLLTGWLQRIPAQWL